MTEINHQSLGTIKLRPSKLARRVVVKIGLTGQLEISLPARFSRRQLGRLITQNETTFAKMLAEHQQKFNYQNGDPVSKNFCFKLSVDNSENQIYLTKQFVVADLVSTQELNNFEVQAEIRATIAKALRKDARHLLVPRLELWSERTGWAYERLRLSHSQTRWGSCSSRGTISLNISLMKLSWPLIDYVIIHELAHTQELNHSPDFWKLVEKNCPNYKNLRRQLRQTSPQV